MDLSSLPFRNDAGDHVAVIEAARGSKNKLKYSPAHEAFELTGVLPIGFAFPYDFGFLPSTLGDDGDPIDVLVLADESIAPGTVVPCRIVGVFEAEQRDAGDERTVRNDRVIAVATHSHRHTHCTVIDDLAPDALHEMERFFVFYNELRGGTFRPLRRGDAAAAEAIIAAGADAFERR